MFISVGVRGGGCGVYKQRNLNLTKYGTTCSLFFYKEDFIENKQNRRLTKTIYRAIYKICNLPPTSKY